MSGIAGIFHSEGRPVHPSDIETMLSAIAHRGPDGSGVWAGGSAGLGQVMLRTTPESLHEHQPLCSMDGSLCLVADARIDNRIELREALLSKGARLRSDTDAELILHAYEAWDEGCPAKIIGDFAFAIWDNRQRRLFCARDPVGIKPLFYHFDGTTLRLSSSPHAIFADRATPKEFNLQFIGRTLLYQFDDAEETLHKDVFRLTPAHSLVFQYGRLTKKRYWDIDPAHTVRHRTDEEYAEHFLEVFRTAVAARLRSLGPTGSLLSGGLDSSSIVCVAQRIMSEKVFGADPLQVFSLVFGETSCDESSFINAVVQRYGLESYQFREEDNPDWLDFERVDEYADVSYSPTLFMIGPAFTQARHANIKTMLTGCGGDEVLASSVVHLTDLVRQLRFFDFYRQLGHDAKSLSCSWWSLLRSYCVKPMIPRSVRAIVKSFIRADRKSQQTDWLTRKSIAIAKSTESRESRSATRLPTKAQQHIYDSVQRGWNVNVAIGNIEAFASHFGIECRHPFYDRRIIEFMIAVPEEQRWCGPWRKRILRNAMVELLPESIRLRPDKANFSPCVDREFRERQAEKIDQLVCTSILDELGLIDKHRFQQLFTKYKDKTASSGARNACRVFVSLEMGCRSDLISGHKEERQNERSELRGQQPIAEQQITCF